MVNSQQRFVILDPRRTKRQWVEVTLAPLGSLHWFRLPFFALRLTPKARAAAKTARAMSKHRNWSNIRKRLTERLLAHYYAGTFAYFAKNPDAIAVCWNGLNGARHIFMQSAKDAGARTLFYELAPLAGRITIDPRGVNQANSLPRDIAPYLSWAQSNPAPDRSWHDLKRDITQRARTTVRDANTQPLPLTAPFVFVALQTPGDSQLRLYGGAFKTVESFVGACIKAAAHLPDGWHMRIKEHPTAPTDFAAKFDGQTSARVFFDNTTDTFEQVAASRAVITVNSSVGLEAMMFEKPVVACGEAFWNIHGVAHSAPDAQSVANTCAIADHLEIDADARSAFLDFLDQAYYPRKTGDAALIQARLNGPDSFGFWRT